MDFIISKIRNETLSYFFAAICLFVLPINAYFVPPFMILWVIARSIEIFVNYKKGFPILYSSRSTLILICLFLLFFFLQVISLLYTKNISNGINIVFSRLALFTIPVLFVSPGNGIKRKSKKLLYYFVLGTVAYVIFCFVYAFYRSMVWQNGHFIFNPHPPEAYWFNYFFGSYFSFNQHPSYTAIFVVFSIIVALEFFAIKDAKRKILIILIIILLIVSLYFLSSRSGFAMGLAGMILLSIIKIKRQKKTLIPLILLVLLFAGSVYVIVSNERVKFYIEMSRSSITKANKKDGRVLIWNSALDVIKENFFLGTGVGDVRDELMKKYKSSDNADLVKNHYNAHNQFLEAAIEGGIINTLVLSIILGYSLYISIFKKNNLLGLFFILIIIFFMSESVLYRFAGVAFFSILSFVTFIYEDSSRMVEV